MLMEFDIKQVILVLLHSSSQPITAKTIQQVCARYHLEFDTAAEEDVFDASAESTGEAADSSAEAQAPADGADAASEPPEAASAARGKVPSLITQTQIRETLAELQAELEASPSPFRIIEGPNGFQITCAPEYADWVRLLRGDPPPIKLTPAALETVSIVAYRQPVTRADMEAIRGVSIDGPLNKLLELELVQATGRADLPGRPIQYGTTDRFLEFCGVSDLESLPASDVLSNREVDSWLKRLNDGDEGPDDDDVGLSPERRQGELPLDETFIDFPDSENRAPSPTQDD